MQTVAALIMFGFGMFVFGVGVEATSREGIGGVGLILVSMLFFAASAVVAFP